MKLVMLYSRKIFEPDPTEILKLIWLILLAPGEVLPIMKHMHGYVPRNEHLFAHFSFAMTMKFLFFFS